MRVFMVEDDELQLRLYRRSVEEQFDDVQLTVEESLARALAYVDGIDRLTAPDLVLLDLQLPDGNGFAVLDRIRARRDLVDLPVMVWSGSDLDADIERAYASGAAAYLVKPSDLDTLRQQVRDCLGFWRHATRADRLATRPRA